MNPVLTWTLKVFLQAPCKCALYAKNPGLFFTHYCNASFTGVATFYRKVSHRLHFLFGPFIGAQNCQLTILITHNLISLSCEKFFNNSDQQKYSVNNEHHHLAFRNKWYRANGVT